MTRPKGSKNISETEAACDMIKARRDYIKQKCKNKTFTIPINDNISDLKLKNKISVLYNTSTGNISISPSGIGYKTISISPSKNQKLICTNQHAIDMLNKQKEIHHKCYKKHKKKVI